MVIVYYTKQDLKELMGLNKPYNDHEWNESIKDYTRWLTAEDVEFPHRAIVGYDEQDDTTLPANCDECIRFHEQREKYKDELSARDRY